MSISPKYLKDQAVYAVESGKADAAAQETQMLAGAQGTQSQQQFQLAGQTEQNGITGFLQSLASAAQGITQAIGRMLSA